VGTSSPNCSHQKALVDEDWELKAGCLTAIYKADARRLIACGFYFMVYGVRSR
jgi:hypothetical protein